ncbi:alpha/beta hydrolase [Rhizobium esperanzae]|uniref:Alpha/beta hydrolase n=1 Tax=Rhizobium esperanzae TaxID=1967781 RepID=A0A246DR93_9HYPH|nr:alpha/beta fold hydrolase [Rhizobium esperanzae]OWO92877.1 alpha/beta hydrolase [Rhizobium esperanzae]
MSAEIKSNYARLSGITMHYLTAGSGKPLVLLHGVPQSSHEWRHVIPFLADKYAIIAPDLRGLGDTSRPADGYDKKTIAEDVWELLSEHLKIDRFNLVGHDWGGPVAFALAAQHREAVSKLAILDVTIPGDGADMSQGGRRWHHPFFRTPDLPEAMFGGREHIYLEWLFDNYGSRANVLSQEDKNEYFRTYLKPGGLRTLLAYYRGFPTDVKDNELFLERDGKLEMPVLALGGDSGFGRGMETMESMQRVASDVRGGLIPGSGHWVAEEAPEFIANELRKFFD